MDEADLIDWTSDESHVLLNPRMPAKERAALERVVPPIRGHVFVATSGTSGAAKLVALSKEAMLASAAAVNSRLDVRPGDLWCRVLPPFHVGGLAIHARAHLTSSRVLTMPWDPLQLVKSETRFVSLVPAQLHDLVRAGLRPPRSLKFALIGGGALDPALKEQASELGWPTLASYGMSECASTIAVEDVLLRHLEARVEPDGRLAFRGASLFSGYVYPDRAFVDPKADGWFVSEDRGWVDGRLINVYGRMGDVVKIGGELVDLAKLDRVLREIAGDDAAIIAVADERLGHVIHLASTVAPESIVEAFNARVMPYERIRGVHRVAEIPRSPLGKLFRNRVLQ